MDIKKMKKRLTYLTIIMIFSVYFPTTVLANINCSAVLGTGLTEIINYIFLAIRVIVPCLVVVLVTIDFVRAVTSGKEEDMKKAQGNAVTRIIIGVIIFFVPTIVSVIINLIGKTNDVCVLG